MVIFQNTQLAHLNLFENPILIQKSCAIIILTKDNFNRPASHIYFVVLQNIITTTVTIRFMTTIMQEDETYEMRMKEKKNILNAKHMDDTKT